MVFFDSPPLLAVTDGQILASKCDGTILVVSSGKTEIGTSGKGERTIKCSQQSYYWGCVK